MQTIPNFALGGKWGRLSVPDLPDADLLDEFPFADGFGCCLYFSAEGVFHLQKQYSTSSTDSWEATITRNESLQFKSSEHAYFLT
jgi:hypothetical protein